MEFVGRCAKIFSFAIKQQQQHLWEEHRVIFCSEIMSSPDVLHKHLRPTGVVVPINIFKVEPDERRHLLTGLNSENFQEDIRTLSRQNAGLFTINPLNAELNLICHLLILLGDLTFM
jgi:hypothetical protein